MESCPECGHPSKPGDYFCRNCGKPLTGGAVWGVQDAELARVYEVSDVSGWLRKPLTIRPTQKALIFVQGKFEGTVPGGVVDMGGLISRIGSLGRTKTMQAVVVHEGAVPLDFSVTEVRTADGFGVSVNCRVTVQVENEMSFYRNAVGDSKVYDTNFLRRQMFEPIRSAVQRQMAGAPLAQLRPPSDRLAAVEQELRERLSEVLGSLGMTVANVSVLGVTHEDMERLDEEREKRAVEEIKAEDELEAREREYARGRTRAAQEIRDYREGADDASARMAIRERLRRISLEEEFMDERARQDRLDFLAEVRKSGLVRDDEIAALERALDEQNQDHELDRKHALELLTVRQAQELLRARTGLDVETIEAEIQKLQADLERQGVLQSGEQELDLRELNHRLIKRMGEVEADIELDQKRYEADRERRNQDHVDKLQQQIEESKTQAETDAIQLDVDKAEMEWLLHVKEQKDRQKLQREQERIAMEEGRLDRELDREIKLADTEHARKLELIDLMSAMPLEQLAAVVDDNERARILADLKGFEITAGMSEEQILAIGAKESPALADALKARFSALAETKSAQEVQRMYERIVETEREHRAQLQDVYDRGADRAVQQAEKAMDAMRDVAKSATGGTSVVLPTGQVVGTGGRPGMWASTSIVLCSNCRTEVPAGAKFCTNCGERV